MYSKIVPGIYKNSAKKTSFCTYTKKFQGKCMYSKIVPRKLYMHKILSRKLLNAVTQINAKKTVRAQNSA